MKVSKSIDILLCLVTISISRWKPSLISICGQAL
jgi:hypothetical protein